MRATIQSQVLPDMTFGSDCSCEIYNEYDELMPASDCWGCWDDEKTYFYDEIMPRWLRANGLEEHDDVIIKASAMGWQRVTAEAVVPATSVLSSLILNGEFTFKVFLTDHDTRLRIIRYSHDEPTGANFEFDHPSKDAL